MASKKIGRIACVLALTGAVGMACAFSGCTVETDHPEATITIKFESGTYELKYKLYRNMYPQTVRHFIELADSGFYDNTIIHNYDSSNFLYCGGYTYDSETYASSVESESMDDYLNAHSKEAAYYSLYMANKLTPSVYNNFVNGSYQNALPTLLGEFSSNVGGHTIEPDTSLQNSFGCLKMYYTTKSTAKNEGYSKYNEIYLKKDGTSSPIIGDFDDGMNSATSLFKIQLSSSTSSDTTYCTFAVLQNSSVLTSLQTAISTYMDDKDLSSFSKSVTGVDIDTYSMAYINGTSVRLSDTVTTTYSVPVSPVWIKSVKITKY
jgi:hypothetical protein